MRFPFRDVEQLFGPSRRRPPTDGLGRKGEEAKIERNKERQIS